MLPLALALGLVPAGGPVVARGLAAVYGHAGDRLAGTGRVGCPAESLRRYGSRSLAKVRRRAMERDGLYVVAMRGEFAACGTLVDIRLHRTGRNATAIVLDRGPYSCYNGGQRITARRCPAQWKRKAVVDLTPELAARLQHNGLEGVTIRASVVVAALRRLAALRE